MQFFLLQISHFCTDLLILDHRFFQKYRAQMTLLSIKRLCREEVPVAWPSWGYNVFFKQKRLLWITGHGKSCHPDETFYFFSSGARTNGFEITGLPFDGFFLSLSSSSKALCHLGFTRLSFFDRTKNNLIIPITYSMAGTLTMNYNPKVEVLLITVPDPAFMPLPLSLIYGDWALFRVSWAGKPK